MRFDTLVPALSRYYHTIRPLHFIQLWYRLWFRIYRPRLPAAIPVQPAFFANWKVPVSRQQTVWASRGGWRCCFIGHCSDYPDRIDWDDARQGKLWLYNLHYFDCLLQHRGALSSSAGAALIDDWVERHDDTNGVGWEPYPLSLRLINWVKWHLAGHPLSDAALSSMALQTHWLSHRVEHHLQANHLLSNAKTLLAMGLFLEGPAADRWLSQGCALLHKELEVQFLEDGGHFELSPMYHAIVLEDLLDLINLIQATRRVLSVSHHSRLETLQKNLKQRVTKAVYWLESMCHPDGEIAFFNDAAFEIAPRLAELRDYALRLGCAVMTDGERGLQRLSHSGYIRAEMQRWTLLIDAAPIGPAIQPGHAHADTLSFELSHGLQRVFVNSGTSTYEVGELRRYQRSTAAHNTLHIDGKNSSEVWGGFRVAQRAFPFDVVSSECAQGISISAAHDGYCRSGANAVHRRRWWLDADQLIVEDSIEGDYEEAEACYLLHPDIVVKTLPGRLGFPDGTVVHYVVRGGEVLVEPAWWYPRFGTAEQTRRIRVRVDGEGRAGLTLRLGNGRSSGDLRDAAKH